jgi:hypothetical protein
MHTLNTTLEQFDEKAKRLFTHEGLCSLVDYPPHAQELDADFVKKFIINSHIDFLESLVARLDGELEIIEDSDFYIGWNDQIDHQITYIRSLITSSRELLTK